MSPLENVALYTTHHHVIYTSSWCLSRLPWHCSTIDYCWLLLFVKQDCTATLCTFRSEIATPHSQREIATPHSQREIATPHSQRENPFPCSPQTSAIIHLTSFLPSPRSLCQDLSLCHLIIATRLGIIICYLNHCWAISDAIQEQIYSMYFILNTNDLQPNP